MRSNSEQVACIVRQCLEEGRRVEIDGLGVFQPHAGGEFEFVPQDEPKVFIAYVQEDLEAAERLFEDFRARRFDPWLDRRKLLPGQNWPRSIEQAIRVSDFFVACLSSNSAVKRGQFHAELRYALDCASRTPLDQIFLIPARLDDCPVPPRIMREIQYVDLFPEWREGFELILAAMEQQKIRNRGRKLRLAG